MKDPLIRLLVFYILAAFLLIAFAMFFSSCRSVKEVTRTEIIYDSTAINENDSLLQVKQERIISLENEIKESQYSGIVFDTLFLPGDTVRNTVIIREDGSIEAAGRIKAATVSKEKMQRLYVELKHSYDSLSQVKNKVQTKVEWKEKIVEKKVKRGWQWWLFWLGLITGCVLWNFLGNKIKLFIQKLFK